MTLGDVMSTMSLHAWAEAGLVIFFLVFVAVAVRTFSPGQRRHLERARHLPLADDTPAPAPSRVRQAMSGPPTMGDAA
jgi:cbb3-type cytochrome oxidase subunit 3